MVRVIYVARGSRLFLFIEKYFTYKPIVFVGKHPHTVVGTFLGSLQRRVRKEKNVRNIYVYRARGKVLIFRRACVHVTQYACSNKFT